MKEIANKMIVCNLHRALLLLFIELIYRAEFWYLFPRFLFLIPIDLSSYVFERVSIQT